MSGWVKLHRSILEWEWYSDTNATRLFLHILLKANHKDKMYKGLLIKRGQLVVGRDALASQVGLTVQQIRTSLNRLKSTSEITIKSTSKGALITVVRYDYYQSSDSELTSEITSDLTNNQPATNQQLTTNKNVKNVKNVRNNNKTLDFSVWHERPSEQVLDDWLAHRKAFKVKVSQTVINRLASEFKKAAALGMSIDDCLSEIVTMGWKGFKADWIDSKREVNGGQSKYQNRKPSLAERTAESQRVAFNLIEAAEADDCAVGENESTISSQMVVSGGRVYDQR